MAQMGTRFEAVSLDVGGVLVVPDHGLLAGALDDLAISYDRSRFGLGHYLAMAAVDRAASDPEDFTDYLWAFLDGVGVDEPARAGAHELLLGLLSTPIWCQPLPGAREGLARLDRAGLRLAVTSNSDGRVEDLLRRHEWVQVGPGPGVTVEVVTDSGNVGVGKPDRRVFDATVDCFGLPAERVLHIGDSVHYDVDGAAAAGLQVAHMDPYALCTADDHAHVRSLGELLDR